MHGKHISPFMGGQLSPTMGKVLQDCDNVPSSTISHNSMDVLNHDSPIPVNVADSTILKNPLERISSDNRRKKNGGMVGKSIEDELCKICGDRASGYHYNALSCEGCKGFFRRSIARNAVYNCKYGGNCEMDMWMRRKCQACRLKRCREVGMKEECLLSEDQCKARDARRKAKQRLNKKTVPSPDSNNQAEFSHDEEKSPGDVKCLSSAVSATSIKSDNPLHILSKEKQELISRLVFYQEKFEYPSDDDVKSISNVNTHDSAEALQKSILNQMAEICVLMTQLVVEFAKRLPGFDTLEKEDQIVLLKAASSEVVTLRASRCYDPNTDSIVFVTGVPCTLENMKSLGMGNYAEVAFTFFRSLSNMKIDNAEYALLIAICIFSDRPGLKNPRLVEDTQQIYVQTLENYETEKRHSGGCSLAILLSRLTELRTISLKHSEDLLELEMDRISIPQLVKEFFSLDKDNIEKESA